MATGARSLGGRTCRSGSPAWRARSSSRRTAGAPSCWVSRANWSASGPSAREGFRYCGSLLASSGEPLFARQAELLDRATALAAATTEAFGLRGVNGIDFIARDGVPYPIEVNPRYSASMELVERATGSRLFAIHAEACVGRLSDQPSPAGQTHGKAIVYARQDLVVDDPTSWTDAPLADLPHRGERIGRGRPICTAFAAARDAAGCRRGLERAAAQIYRATGMRAGARDRRGAA